MRQRSGINTERIGGSGSSNVTVTTFTVTTANATQTTLATIPLNDGTVYKIRAEVVVRTAASANAGGWFFEAVFYRFSGGGAVQVGDLTNMIDQETTNGLDATFTTSGNNVLLRVTGIAATTYSWTAVVTVFAGT